MTDTKSAGGGIDWGVILVSVDPGFFRYGQWRAGPGNRWPPFLTAWGKKFLITRILML